MSFLIVLIFFTSVQDETDPLKRFNFFFSFQTVTAKNGGNQRDFIKILHENIMIFIVINDHIDYFNPTMQCTARTDEKIVLVKYL